MQFLDACLKLVFCLKRVPANHQSMKLIPSVHLNLDSVSNSELGAEG